MSLKLQSWSNQAQSCTCTVKFRLVTFCLNFLKSRQFISNPLMEIAQLKILGTPEKLYVTLVNWVGPAMNVIYRFVILAIFHQMVQNRVNSVPLDFTKTISEPLIAYHAE